MMINIDIVKRLYRKLNFPSGGSSISRGGGTSTPGAGRKPINWQIFCWKLHENEKKLELEGPLKYTSFPHVILHRGNGEQFVKI